MALDTIERLQTECNFLREQGLITGQILLHFQGEVSRRSKMQQVFFLDLHFPDSEQQVIAVAVPLDEWQGLGDWNSFKYNIRCGDIVEVWGYAEVGVGRAFVGLRANSVQVVTTWLSRSGGNIRTAYIPPGPATC
jgi:hypothetical protein